MGPEFTSWYTSDLEIRVRGMVDELSFYNIHGVKIDVDIIERELHDLGVRYEDLPQSCKDMIDELDVE